jgi:ADP-dependent NAD(P)H-hydrate dehydratase / NAD(P)H-hydrate epimerase
MKILSVEEARRVDAYTVDYHKMKSSIDLMEKAASMCCDWISYSLAILSKVKGGRKPAIKVFCGLGNNGGDGLAIARLLAAKKFSVEVFIIRYSDICSDDFTLNEKRLKKLKAVKVHNINSLPDFPPSVKHHPSTIFIDAIFGSGLNRPVKGLAAEAIRYLNESACSVVAIDIPSGLYADKCLEEKEDAVVRALYTLTFQSPKLSFLFPENGVYVGEFFILDIGLNEEYISSQLSKNYYVQELEAKFLYKKRSKFSHKGSFGHALIVSGSYGKIGAAVLSGKACLAAGAGLVTVHIPKCGYSILQTSIPEVMVETDTEEKEISDTVKIDKYSVIGIGPGIGTEQRTGNALKVLIQNSKIPLVLDADALNILAENKTWISFLPPNSILTPHPGEFKRLVGIASNGFDCLQMQKDFSVKHGVCVVLKGAHTCITCPDGEVFFNSTGNPGMATAGSGDVLTGIITGLLAQGYGSKKACILGVYLHGLAGDIAATHLGEESLMASSIVNCLGKAYKMLKNQEVLFPVDIHPQLLNLQ